MDYIANSSGLLGSLYKSLTSTWHQRDPDAQYLWFIVLAMTGAGLFIGSVVLRSYVCAVLALSCIAAAIWLLLHQPD
jgi:hypothetical protein